jgi:hypothetical protein
MYILNNSSLHNNRRFWQPKRFPLETTQEITPLPKTSLFWLIQFILRVLGINIVYGFLCLASSAQHSIAEVLPCCNIYVYIHVYAYIYTHMYLTHINTNSVKFLSVCRILSHNYTPIGRYLGVANLELLWIQIQWSLWIQWKEAHILPHYSRKEFIW